jgi:hypothetical protein
MLRYVGNNSSSHHRIRNISQASRAIQRSLARLKTREGYILGEPQPVPFLQTGNAGDQHPAADRLIQSPAIYATFFSFFPNYSNRCPKPATPKPRLVFFFDEPTLFDNALKAPAIIEQVARLIR